MALVSSSTYSGTPSVLARICSSSSAGSALPLVSLDTIALLCARVSLDRFSAVTWPWLPQLGLELGPMGEHDQQRDGSDPVDQQVEHFKTGGIGPVQRLRTASPWVACARPLR